jgi:hypothetical protein
VAPKREVWGNVGRCLAESGSGGVWSFGKMAQFHTGLITFELGNNLPPITLGFYR